jgi:hypothetical protein
MSRSIRAAQAPQWFAGRDGPGQRKGSAMLWKRIARRFGRRRLRGDGGMSTVEYAIGTVTAAALAGIMYKVVTSPSVQAALTALINRALKS